MADNSIKKAISKAFTNYVKANKLELNKVRKIDDLENLGFFPSSGEGAIVNLNDETKEELLTKFKRAKASGNYEDFLDFASFVVPDYDHASTMVFTDTYNKLFPDENIGEVSYADVAVVLEDKQIAKKLAKASGMDFMKLLTSANDFEQTYKNNEHRLKNLSDIQLNALEKNSDSKNGYKLKENFVNLCEDLSVSADDFLDAITGVESTTIGAGENFNMSIKGRKIDNMRESWMQEFATADERARSLLLSSTMLKLLKIDTDAKDINDLERDQKQLLEHILVSDKKQPLSKILSDLQADANLVNEAVERFYTTKQARLFDEENMSVEVGEVNKEDLVTQIIIDSAYNGALGKTPAEFVSTLAISAAKVGSKFIDPKLRYVYKDKKDVIYNGKTVKQITGTGFVVSNGKLYEIDELPIVLERKNGKIVGTLNQTDTEFEALKHRLKGKYGTSFAKVKKDDVILGTNELARDLISMADQLREQEKPKEVKFDIIKDFSIYQKTDVYLSAREKMRETIRLYAPIGTLVPVPVQETFETPTEDKPKAKEEKTEAPKLETVEEVNADEPEKPVDEPEKPVDEPQKPVDEPEKPVDEPEKPVEEPEKPVDEAEKPVEEPEKPVYEVEKPITDEVKKVEAEKDPQLEFDFEKELEPLPIKKEKTVKPKRAFNINISHDEKKDKWRVDCKRRGCQIVMEFDSEKEVIDALHGSGAVAEAVLNAKQKNRVLGEELNSRFGEKIVNAKPPIKSKQAEVREPEQQSNNPQPELDFGKVDDDGREL